MKRYVAGMAIGLFLGALLTWALGPQPVQGDIAPTGYTLEDIYQFIVTNGGTEPVEGGHSLYPPGAPGQGGMRTLKDIMTALRARLPCHAGSGGQLPATGQTLCYSESGTVDCANPDWPGQDGFYQAGCPMEGRFRDNGDGTVSDLCTGLMWQKATAPGIYTWQEALQYCENLSLAGYTDWRLPNLRELHSIVDCGRDPVASIDPAFEVESLWYWSSTTYPSLADSAWLVGSWGGVYDIWKTERGGVRAVRTGP